MDQGADTHRIDQSQRTAHGEPNAATVLARDGFIVLRGAVSPAALAELEALLAPLMARCGGKRFRDTGRLHGTSAAAQPEIERPTLLEPRLKTCLARRTLADIAATLLGGPARYTYDQAVLKVPGGGAPTAWHQDQAYLSKDVELHTVNFWVPLRAVGPDDGALGFLPGSHLRGLATHHRGDHPDVLTIGDPSDDAAFPIFAAGDVSVHTPLTAHGAGANLSDEPRLAYILHFSRLGRLGYLRPRAARRLCHRLRHGRLA